MSGIQIREISRHERDVEELVGVELRAVAVDRCGVRGSAVGGAAEQIVAEEGRSGSAASGPDRANVQTPSRARP